MKKSNVEKHFPHVMTYAIILLVFLMRSAFGGDFSGSLNAVNGVAMDGFDVVAYFENDGPVKGKIEYAVEYKGSNWYFSSKENAEVFQDSPQSYEPQFNGWCSYGVSFGYGAEVDFINGWAILDGKLYLNWDESTKNGFIKQQKILKPRAHENWSVVGGGLSNGIIAMYFHQDYPETGIAHPQRLK